MKYLTIFQMDKFQSATGFDTKAEAEKFVQACATAAKTKALKNNETDDYILAMNNGKELCVSIKEVDTLVKYEISYDKNGEHVETNYYDTREKAVSAAKKIIDDLDYSASEEENHYGRWSIDNAEQNLKVAVSLKLVLMGAERENVIETYNCYDMEYAASHFDEIAAEYALVEQVTASVTVKEARKRGIKNLCIGAGIAVAGLIFTGLSYNNAKPGGTYTVYTGVIAIGVVDALIGLYYIINPKAALPKDKKKK